MAQPRLHLVDTSAPSDILEPLKRVMDGEEIVLFPTFQDPDQSVSTLPPEARLIIQTSGSTAKPKRVWSTLDALSAAADQVNSELAGPGHWWSVLPTHYIAGLMVVLRALRSDSSLYFGKATGVLDFDQRVREHSSDSPRYTSVVPKQLADLVSHAEQDQRVADVLRRFERILVGGQRTPPELIDRAQALGLRVVRTYGSAETAGGCVWEGRALGQTRLDILDGQVAIAGPMLAGGYVDDELLTERHFLDRDGTRWFRSSDLGRIEKGILTVTGRADRVIVSGGVKVNLDELQDAAQRELGPRHLVSSKLDETWGEVPVLLAEEPVDLAQLSQLTPGTGDAAWTIRHVVVTSLPELASGKWDLMRAAQIASGNSDGSPE